jgi:hypothetical protein
MEGLYAKSILVIFTTLFFKPFIYTVFLCSFLSEQGYISNQFHSNTYRQWRKKFAKENNSLENKDFSIQFSMISETALHFVQYPPLARMIFW